MDALDWLLDADPAIRWQALRDLTDAPPDQVATERARVATEGWGPRLLSLRRADGLSALSAVSIWQSAGRGRRGSEAAGNADGLKSRNMSATSGWIPGPVPVESRSAFPDDQRGEEQSPVQTQP